MRSLLIAAAALLAVAAPLSGAATAGRVGLSASPTRLALTGRSSASIVVRNAGDRPLLVDVSRAGFARSLRGRPRVRPARRHDTWLRLRARRLRLAARGTATLRVRAAPTRRTGPGDHSALVLLTTRPAGSRRVHLRVRLGIVVVLRVPGRIVRRLEVRSLVVRRHGRQRLLELRLVNRGNQTERLGGSQLRVVLLRGRRRIAILRPRRRELLPRSTGIAELAYRGRARGDLVARVVLGPGERGRTRAFHVHF